MLIFLFFASFFSLLISVNLLITKPPPYNDSGIFCMELPLLTGADAHGYSDKNTHLIHDTIQHHLLVS